MLRFKEYLTEADTSTATLTEMAICYQFNTTIKNMDHETAMKEAEIEPKSFSKFEGLLETGKNMVEGLVKEDSGIAKQNKAVHYGGGSDGVTPFWSKYGAGAKAASRTPKTDLYIGKYNISLKMGAAQLMSGFKEESFATFYAALEETDGLANTPEVKDCISLIEKFSRGITIGTTASVIKNKTDDAVVDANRVHKELMNKLGVMFEKNSKFKFEFVKEAMSGYKKFGKGSRAAAEYFLVGGKGGKSVSFHSIDDDSYVSKVVGAMTLSVKMKSTSRKTLDAAPGERTWWSALGLTVKDMSKKLQKEEYLSEGIISNIISKARNALGKTMKTVKGLVKKTFSKFLDYVAVKPEVSYTIKF